MKEKTVIKYRIEVYYHTEASRKVTKWMRRIMDDWKKAGKEMVNCKVFEFKTDRRLTPEEIRKLKDLKEDWMDEIVVSEE